MVLGDGTVDGRKSCHRVPVLGWRVALLLFGFVFVVHALSPSVQVGDSRLSVDVSTQVLRHQTLDLNGIPEVTALKSHYDVRSHGGRVLPFFPWPAMLFALPGAAVLDVIGKDPESLKPSDPNQTWIVEIPTASALVGLTAVVMSLIAFDAFGGSVSTRRRRAVAIGLLFGFATGAWSTGSRALWQQTPSMLFLALALYFALHIDRSRRTSSPLLGACLGAAYVVRPTNAVAVVAFVVWVMVSSRRRLVPVLAGIAVVILPFVLVNLTSYGAILPSYYAGSRLGHEATIPFANAAAMFLVSPSRGLLVYDPLVIVSGIGCWLLLRRRTFTALHATIIVIMIAQWIVIASFGGTGGSAYGPRLLTDVLPFVVFLAIPVFVAVFDGAPWRQAKAARKLVVTALVVVIAWSLAVNAS
ncbi:MAG: hypothetical protein ACXVJO_18035, partial [Thermoanaerobaculia bacterium]